MPIAQSNQAIGFHHHHSQRGIDEQRCGAEGGLGGAGGIPPARHGSASIASITRGSIKCTSSSDHERGGGRAFDKPRKSDSSAHRAAAIDGRHACSLYNDRRGFLAVGSWDSPVLPRVVLLVYSSMCDIVIQYTGS
eukprot:scaffold262937_cov37-Tisochrysis_lutea.AAC.1